MGILESLGAAIAKYVVPPIADAIAKEFERHTPELVKAVVAAVITTSASIVGKEVDQITDLIPGPIDDAIVDPIAKRVLDWLSGLGR